MNRSRIAIAAKHRREHETHADRKERELEMLHERGPDRAQVVVDAAPPDERRATDAAGQRSRREPLADAADVEEAEVVVPSPSTTITTCVGELTSASSACRSESARAHHDRERRRLDLVDALVPGEGARAIQPRGGPVVEHRDPVDSFTRHHRARVADRRRRRRRSVPARASADETGISASRFRPRSAPRNSSTKSLDGCGEHVDGRRRTARARPRR